jgi:hypothetical protein
MSVLTANHTHNVASMRGRVASHSSDATVLSLVLIGILPGTDAVPTRTLSPARNTSHSIGNPNVPIGPQLCRTRPSIEKSKITRAHLMATDLSDTKAEGP